MLCHAGLARLERARVRREIEYEGRACYDLFGDGAQLAAVEPERARCSPAPGKWMAIRSTALGSSSATEPGHRSATL